MSISHINLEVNGELNDDDNKTNLLQYVMQLISSRGNHIEQSSHMIPAAIRTTWRSIAPVRPQFLATE